MSDNDRALTIQSQNALMPAMDIGQAVARYEAMAHFVQRILKDGIDFGKIPGTGNKPTLLKPGAEKLTTFFGLRPTFQIVERVEDWTGKEYGEPFFYYHFRCQLWHGGEVIAEGDGSCNSWESKYRYRWVGVDELPPGADVTRLKKRVGSLTEFDFAVDKAETTGKYGKPAEYWQQFRDAIEDGTANKAKKTTRAGKEYDAWEISTTVFRIPNDDVASQVNTIQKMGQKRALVAATLIGVNASDYFTQDLDDLTDSFVEGEYTTVPDNGDEQPEQPKAKAKPRKSNGNGKKKPQVYPSDFLDQVNRQVQVPYDAQKHLFNALKKELGKGWNWPAPDDLEAWGQAEEAAIRHAEAKLEAEGDQDELPLE
jgi:hypothetical protein